MKDREPVDPALDAMLRDHSAETPPAHVDAAILAAAHRAVGTSPRASSRRHWRLWLPLAAAASVTAVVIGLQGVEPQEPNPSNTAPPTAKLQSPAAATSSPRPAQSSAPPPVRRDEAAAAAAAKAARSEVAADAREAPRAAAPEQRAREAAATSAELSQDARVADAIARIRALRRYGREAEAVAALAQLRETVSDADSRLPPDLRTWASTVRRQ